MTKTFISPELRTAGIVPRWSIVRTIQRDLVAGHSFFVTMYVTDIARVIGWQGDLAALMYLALTHDLDETLIGDIVSPVKSEILDNSRMAEFIDAQLSKRLPTIWKEVIALENKHDGTDLDEMYNIVKAADRMDALLYLIGESRLGNTYVTSLINQATNLLEAAWRQLPASDDVIDMTWNTQVLSAIAAHYNEGGGGL